MSQQVDKTKAEAHWKDSVRITTIIMGIWFLVGYVATFFSATLNAIVIFGFPFGYYMGAQGSLVIFVVLIFWYAKYMNAKDDEYGVGEEEE